MLSERLDIRIARGTHADRVWHTAAPDARCRVTAVSLTSSRSLFALTPIIRSVKWFASPSYVRGSAVLLAYALLVGACGASRPDDPPTGKTGGEQAEEQVVDELGLKRPHAQVPLRLCDRSGVEVVQVDGDTAIETWRELRGRARTSGLWPVVIGSPEDASLLADTVRFNCKDGHTFERTLKRASKVDVEHAIARVARSYGVRARDLRGSTPLPDHPPSDQFLVPLDVLTEEPLREVWIALLPIDESWKATAILPWGNYNENPQPAVHTAVLRDWSRRYGAELVSMTGDVLEMSVTRPPTGEQAALALAREQFSYSPDIVQQGVGDIETLAASLQNGHAWYSWRD
jgi:hypothetical protein